MGHICETKSPKRQSLDVKKENQSEWAIVICFFKHMELYVDFNNSIDKL